MKVVPKIHPEHGGPSAHQNATESVLLAQELCLRKGEYGNGEIGGGDCGAD